MTGDAELKRLLVLEKSTGARHAGMQSAIAGAHDRLTEQITKLRKARRKLRGAELDDANEAYQRAIRLRALARQGAGVLDETGRA
jgi:hypothetical protein